ncbi:unnamed protein product [Boreogadus saida]
MQDFVRNTPPWFPAPSIRGTGLWWERVRVAGYLADNLPMDDLIFHEQLLTPHLAPAGVGGFSSASSPPWRWSLALVLLLTLSILLIGHY